MCVCLGIVRKSKCQHYQKCTQYVFLWPPPLPTKRVLDRGSDPGFEYFATVSKIRHFRSLHWRPSLRLSCINAYLAIDSGGNVSDLVIVRNCRMVRMLPGEAELVSE